MKAEDKGKKRMERRGEQGENKEKEKREGERQTEQGKNGKARE